ncbi:MAG TPA: divalent-cation tolerance protein CutA [Streptomyces sp.]|jgi:periplasmic divalent cation tolerance protein|nr:divalent-cation tolerance protein CutA [Streptomyces sp.]
MPEIVTVLTTVDSAEEAERLARGLVEQRLAACVQVGGPVTSYYRWEGAVQADREWQLLCKTRADRYPALEAHLRREHPYDVPEIIATPLVGGHTDYLRWVARETDDPSATAGA